MLAQEKETFPFFPGACAYAYFTSAMLILQARNWHKRKNAKVHQLVFQVFQLKLRMRMLLGRISLYLCIRLRLS